MLAKALPSLLRATLPGKGFVLALAMRLHPPIVRIWARVDSDLLQHNWWLCLGAALRWQLRDGRLHSLGAANLTLSFGLGFSFRLPFGFGLLDRWSLLRHGPGRASFQDALVFRSLCLGSLLSTRFKVKQTRVFQVQAPPLHFLTMPKWCYVLSF